MRRKEKMSNRNRDAGLNYERSICQKLNRITLGREGEKLTGEELRKVLVDKFTVFPKLACTREVNRAADARKLDITTTVKEDEGRFPYNIQAKSYSTKVDYPTLLEEVKTNNKKGIPVVFHKFTKKAEKKFINKGEFAILYLDDFIDMMFQIQELKLKLNGNK
jgi:hypothetical protein